MILGPRRGGRAARTPCRLGGSRAAPSPDFADQARERSRRGEVPLHPCPVNWDRVAWAGARVTISSVPTELGEEVRRSLPAAPSRRACPRRQLLLGLVAEQEPEQRDAPSGSERILSGVRPGSASPVRSRSRPGNERIALGIVVPAHRPSRDLPSTLHGRRPVRAPARSPGSSPGGLPGLVGLAASGTRKRSTCDRPEQRRSRGRGFSLILQLDGLVEIAAGGSPGLRAISVVRPGDLFSLRLLGRLAEIDRGVGRLDGSASDVRLNSSRRTWTGSSGLGSNESEVGDRRA